MNEGGQLEKLDDEDEDKEQCRETRTVVLLDGRGVCANLDVSENMAGWVGDRSPLMTEQQEWQFTSMEGKEK